MRLGWTIHEARRDDTLRSKYWRFAWLRGKHYNVHVRLYDGFSSFRAIRQFRAI
jgi:hypothetical protein